MVPSVRTQAQMLRKSSSAVLGHLSHCTARCLDEPSSTISGECRRLSSFLDIFETLKQQDFKIWPWVETAEVLSFVGWVEVLEQCRE
jgi:hypothetical protein